MAPHHTSSPPGAGHESSVRRYTSENAPRCSCVHRPVLIGIVSIDAGKCASCRVQERASMPLEQLQQLRNTYDARGRAREALGLYLAAADFFTEARSLDLAITAKLEALSNA
jgi:hypothetical protein